MHIDLMVDVPWRTAWRRAAPAALASVVLALGVTVAIPGVAEAAPYCQSDASGGYCSYGFTGGEQTFVVPAGMTDVRIDVSGGAGGAGGQYGGRPPLAGTGSSSAAGGFGNGVVDEHVAVTPGETLTIVAGGNGGFGGDATAGAPRTTSTYGYAAGGAGGTKRSGTDAGTVTNGGAGGGASAVLRGTDPILVGGGGGGGGGNRYGMYQGGSGGNGGGDQTYVLTDGGDGQGGGPDYRTARGGAAGGASGRDGGTGADAASGGAVYDGVGGGAGGGGGGGVEFGGAGGAGQGNGGGGGGGAGLSLLSPGAVYGFFNGGPGGVVISWSAPAPATPAAISASGGDGQQAPAGDPFPARLAAKVTDGTGAPLADQEVTFTVTEGSSRFPDGATATARTDASGVATAPVLTAGADPGTTRVTAAVNGVATPATFTETVTAPAPASITPKAGGGQSAAAGTRFPTPLAATVLDASGRPVAGRTVTFTVAGPASFPDGTTARATTGSDGVATAPALTAGPGTGSVRVIAAVDGVDAPATFVETVTPAPVTPPPAPAAPVVGGAGVVQGGGQNMSFSVAISPSGRGATGGCSVAAPGLALRCASITTYTRTGTTVTFGGRAVNQAGKLVDFTATVVDRANPNGAGRDSFVVTVGGKRYGGTLTVGNVTVR